MILRSHFSFSCLFSSQGGSDLEVILYLLQTEFVPLCLCSIEKGSPTSKTVRNLAFTLFDILLLYFGDHGVLGILPGLYNQIKTTK